MVGRIKKTSRSVEQKEGVVYVDQPPRSEYLPSISPDSLKFETQLRFLDIPYEHIGHESLTITNSGDLPHCKVGGKEVPYSNHIVSEVAKAVNKEITETETAVLDKGAQRAFEGLIEGSLYWVLVYIRATQTNQLPPSDAFQGRWRFLRTIADKVAVNKLKTKADYQGIGRHNTADVIDTGKQDLRAISTFLGDKPYLAGEQPNKLDATAFAHLAQFWFTPADNELKTFIKEQCPNLIDYVDRIKTRYWPDWEEKCRKPAPPRRTKSKDETAATEEKAEAVAETVNGASEKETDEQPAKQVQSTIEVVQVTTTVVEKPAAENGAAEEHKHAATPNGGTTDEKVTTE